jgi:uncharacterized protein (UPF0335 family)
MAKRAAALTEIDPQEGYQQLADLVRRIEAEEDAKDTVVADIKEIYHEAKLAGLDVPTLRRIIRKRRADQEKLRKLEELLGRYEGALERAGTNH